MAKEKKKILFVCQYFYPEVFRGNDVAFHLAEEGHEVHVVTGIPNYPGGKFFDGYSWWKKRHEVVNGVKVTRLPIIPRGNNKIMLMLNYFSYMIVASVWMLFHAIRHKYDLVFCQQLSPVNMVAPAILYKKLRHVPLYTWVLDLWPESLQVLGHVNNKYILGFFDLFVMSEYKNSDKILVSSRSFADSIKKYGNYQEKVIYYPQWADGIDAKSTGKTNIPQLPDGFKLMFAGAVGEAHGFDCTMQAALLTKEYKDMKWVIVGDGRRLEFVKDFIKQNSLEDTVLTLGRYPAETMPYFFKQADVLLVALNDDPLFKMYAPAKIASYMSSGKPIIGVLNGEGANVIKEANCGWNVACGDAKSFAELAIELYKSDKALLKERGNNGLEYYNENYIKEKCLFKLHDILEL